MRKYGICNQRSLVRSFLSSILVGFNHLSFTARKPEGRKKQRQKNLLTGCLVIVVRNDSFIDSKYHSLVPSNYFKGLSPRVIVLALTNRGHSVLYCPAHSCLRLEVTFTAVI